MKTNIIRKTAAVLMSLALIITFTGLGTSASDAYAATGTASKITVYVTVINGADIAKSGDKLMVNVPVKVNKEEGKSYALYSTAMTALHAKYCTDGYAASSDGWVTKFWGIKGANTLFTINNVATTEVLSSTKITNGQRLTAAIIRDAKTYADYYSYFTPRIVNTVAGGTFTLNLNGYMGMGLDKTPAAIKGAKIGVVTDGGFKAIEGTVTDDKGSATVTLDKATFKTGNTYYLTAEGTVKTTAQDYSSGSPVDVQVDAPIIPPVCVVKVVTPAVYSVCQASITNLTADRINNTMTVTWGTDYSDKLDGYVVYRSTKADWGYVKVGTVTTQKYSVTKKTKCNYTVYYKVKGYKVIDGARVYTKTATASIRPN